MNHYVLLGIVLSYFLLLFFIAWYTSRNNSSNESFFIGNKNSHWWLVAFGMIGTSLSGVTFVSVPGTVGDFVGDSYKGFGYFQVVLGYFIGYFVVAHILLPIYYKMNLTSIYVYLEKRLGFRAYKTGALFFQISRTIGATARLYLVINVLQVFILDALGVPFLVTTLVILIMILIYTYEGGVSTIVYTDTLQTAFMLLGLIVCVGYIMSDLDYSTGMAIKDMSNKGYFDLFNFDVKSKGYFLKQIIGGMFITISMTGLDQEMMQKNISVKTLGDSKKNMMTFSVIMVVVTFLFLFLGGLLYMYMLNKGAVYVDKTFIDSNGQNIIGDNLFPTVALQHMPAMFSIVFIIGLISALFPSADGALTALTSSFCIDILGIQKRTNLTEQQQKKIRQRVHLVMTLIFLICILIFKWIDDKSIIGIILDVAGYTYGPLLGLFAFGILTKRHLNNNIWVVVICFVAPLISYVLSKYSTTLFNGYAIGIELLLINALLVYGMLYFNSKKQLVKTYDAAE
jgi:Na+/proline symporter